MAADFGFWMLSYPCRSLLILQGILDACPSLEHLVTIWDDSLTISHRNIKWIDLWPSILPQCGNDFPWVHWAKIMRQASERQTALPALQGIRILLHGLPFISSIPLFILRLVALPAR